MNSVQLTMLGSAIYVGLHHILTPVITSDECNKCNKTNQFSSFVYFCGVVYLVYKVNKQYSSPSNLLTQILMSVVGSVMIYEIMMNVIWRKIECLVLEVLKSSLYKVLNKFGYDFNTNIPFVVLLYGISFSFLNVAFKSDSIFETLFKPSGDGEVTDSTSTQTIYIVQSSSTTANEDSEVDGSEIDTSNHHIPQVHHEDSGMVNRHCIARSVNTLPSEFVSLPPRRSLRSRSGRRSLTCQKK